MWKKSERQVESYKIWAMAFLLICVCLSLYYFHVILGIGTIVTHIFYVPIVLAAFWWKRKGLVVALFSSGLLIISHVFLRPDMASHNDYFRAFMFMITAFVIAELSRRIAKEHEALQTANQQLKAGEQQLKASNQQLRANEQQLINEVAERKSAEEMIREQSEFLRNVIESLSHPFYVIDANDNTVKMANSTALQGKLPEKITCYMLSHKQNKACDGTDHPCPLEDIKKTKQPVIVEHIHYDKDGNSRNIEVHAYPIFDNEQNVTQIIEYCMDITKRKKAEETLKKERDFSENLINTAQTIVLVLDADGKIVSFNPYMEELSGYRLEEVKGKDWFTTFLPECDYDEIRRLFKKAISDNRTRGNVNPIVRKDGEQRLIEWHDKTLKDDKGNIIGLLAIGQDITERHKAEEALKNSEQKYKGLIETAIDGYVMTNMQGKILDCNKAFLDMIGYTMEKAKKLRYQDITPQKWHKMEEEIVKSQFIKNGYSDVYEKEYIRKDGTVFPISIRGRLIKDEKGQASGMWGFVRDITERKKAERNLQESENKFRSIAENAVDFIFIKDMARRYTFVNQAMQKLLGLPEEEIIGKTPEEIFGPEQGHIVKEVDDRTFSGETVNETRRFAIGDNELFFNTLQTPLTMDDGKVTSIMGIVRDITERKRAEEALRESEEFSSSLLCNSPNPIVVINPDTSVKYVNPALERLTGFSSAEIIGKKAPYLWWTEETLHSTGRDLKKAMSKGAVSIEELFKKKDGERFWVEITSGPIIENGKFKYYLANWIDITERKKAEEKLQESELKFKTIFENAGGAIFIADNKTGKILECNSQAEQLLGRPRAEIIGMHQSELHPKGEEKKYKEKFASHVRKGHTVDFEGEVQHKDGRRTPVWIAAQCLKIDGKDAIIGLFVDTTERKKTEQELIENQKKLKSLASQLSVIEERERHRLATELHDQIGQSLVMSKMKLDLLRSSISSGESTDILGEVCDCLGQVIQDTRTLTFDLSDPILYEFGFEAAVDEWLDEQVRKKHGIKTEFEDDGRPKPLDDDIRALLFRNVRELLINTVKHANAKKVKVSIHKVDDQIYVSIEDNGVGFDPAEVASKATFGLFSIRQRLEQLGGFLEIDSEPGGGSRFTMTAPLKLAKTNSSPHNTWPTNGLG